MKYIKSPLNYTGGKYKLLNQILPLFPEEINTFVDLFTGGCNVAVNVNANNKVCNDSEKHVIGLMNYFKENDSKNVVESVKELIRKYGLSDTSTNGYDFYGCNSSKGVATYNKEKYLKLREDYNKNTENHIYFFTTLIFSFNNQIKFNLSEKFNSPVNKRDFNKNMENNTINFVDNINDGFTFLNKDFREFDFNPLTNDDLVYCDPPYLVSKATYNEGWTEKDEKDLLCILDSLDDKGIKFALSNVFESKGKSNNILKEWSKKYNVHYINANYGNCSYHGKDKSKDSTIEVLITNYN